MRSGRVDMLLLNCTNLRWRPIFPYAFVQVSEVAARYGLTVERQDLLYVDRWEENIKTLIRNKKPACIGLHIRQIDTLDLNDYLSINASKSEYYRTFYPLYNAKQIISKIRKYTNAPIVLGGFGFTAHAANVANYLEVDLGVRGCPDGFFEHFDSAIAGKNLNGVPGLMHHNGTYIENPIVNASPANGLEYNHSIIAEIKQFYGPMLQSENPPTIAIEVARGCPFSCYFCTEPDVKGTKVRRRNTDTIKAELEQLIAYGFRHFWFICSELNIGGSQFVTQLADLVNEIQGKKRVKISWSGYSLPTLNRDEMKYLKAAGYVGAMNDLLSLDDENLKKSRVPYKKSQAIEFLIHMSGDAITSEESNNEDKYTANSPSKFSDVISMFLGNAFIDSQAIANTLDEMEKHQLSSLYNHGHIIPSTRVFPIGRTENLVDKKTTLSFDTFGLCNTDTNLPTFHFPEFMVNDLGSHEEVIEFLQFVADTYLSKAYSKSLCMTEFVVSTIDLYQDRNERVQSMLETLMNEIYGINAEEKREPIFLNSKQMTEDDAINVSSLSMLSYWPYKKYESALQNPDNDSVSNSVSKIFNSGYDAIKRIQIDINKDWFDRFEYKGTPYAFTRHVMQRYESISKFRKSILKSETHISDPIPTIYLEYLIFITRTKKGSSYRNLIASFSNADKAMCEPA